MKFGEKAMTRQPSRVGKQLMTPHRISVNLLGGLIDRLRVMKQREVVVLVLYWYVYCTHLGSEID
jgi:hypothetical protein